MREMISEVEANMLRIQNSEHPVQSDIIREQRDEIADPRNQSQSLRSKLMK